MKRAILDTSVYGRIIEKNEIEQFRELIKNKIIIYGNQLIRKELRDTPKKIKIPDKEKLRNLRIYLLTLYDEIVKNHSFEITKEMLNLAENYYAVYRELGGNKGKESIIIDFTIIACASIKGMDVVVSDDEKTMLSRNAIRAYKLVNNIKKERTPNFISYKIMKQILRSGNFNKISDSSFKFGIFNIFLILLPYFFTSLFFSFHNKLNVSKYIKLSIRQIPKG